jgi:uncharacterized membrane protein
LEIIFPGLEFRFLLWHTALAVTSARKRWTGKFVIVLVIAGAVYLAYPAMLEILASILKELSFLFQVFGYAAALVIVPFFLWIIAEAGYKVFLRAPLRAWRIRQIRHRRLLREAAARDHTALE